MRNVVMYLIVNKEAGISAPKLSGQVGHGVGEYYESILNLSKDSKKRKLHQEWVDNNVTKIILSAKEKDLLELEKYGFPVRDAGKTECPANTFTVLCLGVDNKEDFVKRFPKLKKMQLLKEKK